MARTTALEDTPIDGLATRKPIEKENATEAENEEEENKRNKAKLEFVHSVPIHIDSRASILSRENTEGLSFRGFGNLACSSSSLRQF